MIDEVWGAAAWPEYSQEVGEANARLMKHMLKEIDRELGLDMKSLFSSHNWTESDLAQLGEIHTAADNLLNVINTINGNPRYMSLAITSLEEAAAWAIKTISRKDCDNHNDSVGDE